jgi:N-acetylmuramoyl-L-alanine amidase
MLRADHRNRLVVTLGMLALLALPAGLPGGPARASDQPLAGRIVALDPGHFETATDTGAVNERVQPRLVERDVNWEVVLVTRAKLEALGVAVVLTRQEGEYLDRPTRYAIANAAGAQVLASVHHNGSTDTRVNYTATFYTQPGDKGIASLAYQQLTLQLGFTGGGGVWRDAFGMTVKPKMPSTLTESWFITHDTTAQRYWSEWGQRTSWTPGLGWAAGSLVEREAQALADAIAAFLTSGSGGKGKPAR